jgi:hypothetical protein
MQARQPARAAEEELDDELGEIAMGELAEEIVVGAEVVESRRGTRF